MELQTIRQYAESQKVSYEAVRAQVVRYREELRDHIVRKQRTQYLDDYAVNFLNERRRENPVILMRQDSSEEIEDLKQQVENLKAQLMKAQTEIMNSQEERLKLQERIISLQDETRSAIEARTKYEGLLTDHEATKAALQDAQQQIVVVTAEKDRAERERDDKGQQLNRAEEELSSVSEKLEAVTAERDAAKQEADSFVPSFFGFFRKRT